MKADKRTFTAFLNGNRQFVIPVFQRDYSWMAKQCERLWNDVWRAGDVEVTPHFMGSVVCVNTGQTSPAFGSWLVIDGQQRLTTLTLLLIALRNHIRDTGWQGGEESPTAEKIDAYFLKNTLEQGAKRYKLALRRYDDAMLRRLVDVDASDEANRSPFVWDAFEWFTGQVAKSSESHPSGVDRIYRGICNLEIVDVTLDQKDHPQLVFESLNSTGVDLTQSDLVRNYILMELDERKQTFLYEEYWAKIEEPFKRTGVNLDLFLRDYIALKSTPPSPAPIIRYRADRVYDEGLEVLLKDLRRFAGYYLALLGHGAKPGILAEAMRHCRSLITQHTVLGMRLYDCHDRPEPTLSEAEFADALRLIESYFVRREVLGLQGRSYWEAFAEVARSVKDEQPLVSLKVALAMQRLYRFPDDVQFQRELRDGDLYGKPKVCRHILARMENDQQREPSPIDGLTIEHIMPQCAADVPAWREMLGDGWQEVCDRWLHRLGNLTLTAYNSEMSARPFADKKTITGGFDQSAVRLNAFVRDQEVWTESEMSVRGERLAQRALSIWPHHGAKGELVRQERLNALRDQAMSMNSSDIKMSAEVRKLLNSAEAAIGGIGDVVQVVRGGRSVCCYVPEFLLEIIPMRSHLRLVLPLDIDDVEVREGLVPWDASTWKKNVPNRFHRDHDTIVDVYDEEQLHLTLSIVRQAYEQVSDPV